MPPFLRAQIDVVILSRNLCTSFINYSEGCAPRIKIPVFHPVLRLKYCSSLGFLGEVTDSRAGTGKEGPPEMPGVCQRPRSQLEGVPTGHVSVSNK